MIKVGNKAKAFTLLDGEESKVSLNDFAGKWVILYFYPKDATSGCTREAIDFSARIDEFANEDAVVIGISKDSCASHAKFASKHNLTVLLLSDPDAKTQEAYGVWQLKKRAGKEYMGTVRTTYLIAPDGCVAHVWENVKVDGHAEKVMAKLSECKEEGST